MAGKDDEPTPPGWYRQHDDPGTLRWWDGDDWTADTMPAPAAGSRAPSPPDQAQRPARPAEQPSARSPAHAAAGPPSAAGRRSQSQRSQGGRSQGGRSQEARRRQEATRRQPTTQTTGAPRSRSSGPATGTARRPPQRMAARGRTVQSERVVRRRSTGPGPGVRIGLRALLLAAVVGVLYLGYVQIRDAEAPDARTLAEEPTATPDERLTPVAEAVLTLGDLPGGWSAQAHDAASDDICQGRTPRSVITPDDIASAGFTQGSLGPYLTTTIARFADEETSRAFMDLTERVVESCREHQVGDATVRLGPLDYPRFGDDTFVAAASGDSTIGTITGRLVYVRVGRLVASVETLALGDGEVSDQLVEHLANLLSKRMRAL